MVRNSADEPCIQWIMLGCAGLASLLVAVGVFQVILFVGGSGSPSPPPDGVTVAPLERHGQRVRTAEEQMVLLRREIEDSALEGLRLHLRQESDGAGEAAARRSGRSDTEDEEMSTIFEIVRLAQERHNAEDHHVTGSNETFVDGDGIMLPTLKNAACLVPEDCKRACEEECAALAVKQHCANECSSICQGSCLKKGGEGAGTCSEACQDTCQPKCARGKADQLLLQRERCEAAAESACHTSCSNQSNAAAAASGAVALEQLKGACTTECMAAAATACAKEVHPPCASQCGAHLCSDSQCRCPVYSSGNPMCSSPLDVAAHLPARFADCAATMAHPKFSTGTGHPASNFTFLNLANPLTLQNVMQARRSRAGTSLAGTPDLQSMADFSTCAVVGSSNSMAGGGRGAEIDAHTAVLRFNDAPTFGHHEDVGNKTTLRIQNVMTCGFHEGVDEICLHYTSWAGNECEREELDWWRECRFVRPSQRSLAFVRHLFGDPRASFTRGNSAMRAVARGRRKAANRDTSAGFFGVGLALHLCGKIDIYGFTQGSGHYYRKVDRSRGQRKFAAKHAWALERQCLGVVSSLQGVSRIS